MCANFLPSIAVVYLARAAEGREAYRAFLRSYAAHPAGIEHDLIVIFKGFADQEELMQARAEFSSFSHLSIELDDHGFDLGSYFAAAERLSHRYVCFFNTFSDILDDHWLVKLHRNLCKEDVGLVGCTGSYESTSHYITLLHKAIWTHSQGLPKAQHKLEKYFSSFLPDYFARKNHLTRPPTFLAYSKALYRFLRNHAKSFFRLASRETENEIEGRYQKWWQNTQTQGDLIHFMQFPPFPNPHLRTNAFMIRREQFLKLERSQFITKFDACFFESGKYSMTKQLLDAGLKVQVVGRDGQGYDVAHWNISGTFRHANQFNLLVSDNQTRAFANASRETQLIQMVSTWGENAVSLPQDYPDLGIRFISSR